MSFLYKKPVAELSKNDTESPDNSSDTTVQMALVCKCKISKNGKEVSPSWVKAHKGSNYEEIKNKIQASCEERTQHLSTVVIRYSFQNLYDCINVNPNNNFIMCFK